MEKLYKEIEDNGYKLISESLKVDDFLKELSDLTNKYGIVIEGCGCCGSPFLEKNKEEGNYEIRNNSYGELVDLTFETIKEKEKKKKRQEEYENQKNNNPNELPF